MKQENDGTIKRTTAGAWLMVSASAEQAKLYGKEAVYINDCKSQ